MYSSQYLSRLLAKDLPALNEVLKGKGQQEISPPPEKVALKEDTANFAGGAINRSIDVDGPAAGAAVPANFRVSR